MNDEEFPIVLVSIVEDCSPHRLVVLPLPVVVGPRRLKETSDAMLVPINKLALVVVLVILLGNFVVEVRLMDFL